MTRLQDLDLKSINLADIHNQFHKKLSKEDKSKPNKMNNNVKANGGSESSTK